MLKALFVAIGLLLAVPAQAEEPKTRGPIEAAEDEIKENKSEKQLAAEERLRALEESQGERLARVVVLPWENSDTDHTNETLQGNIRVRIARPNAKFYPEIDLYQAGRKEADRNLDPKDQRAVVPEMSIDRVLSAVDDAATIPWNAMSAQDWGLKAHELKDLSDEVWFVDRPDLREPVFLLYSQIGRAAESSNNPAPPFFEQVGGRPVNYYWYLAGAMAHEEPALMSKLTDQDMHASIGYYKDLLDRGEFPPMTLSFELNSRWDAKEFASEYQLYINGIEVLVTDDKGLHRAAPGRVDVYMSRDDGHSLSDRIELDKLDDKFYFVRDVARKRMGLDFVDQLMEHPNECTPEVAGDILNYLSIYAKLHGEAEIYIAVPVGGSTASNKILLWRWDRPQGNLQKVLDDTGGFPVRFALTVGAGLSFSNATYTPPTGQEIANASAAANPTDPTAGFDAAKRTLDVLPDFAPAGLPIAYELRGHYGRLLVSTGLEFALNLTGEGQWREMYQTNTIDGPEHELTELQTVTVLVPAAATGTGTGTGTGTNTNAGAVNCVEFPDLCEEVEVQVPVDVLRERDWQRLVFLGVGVVLGRNAAVGFGPYGLIRTGWYNNPHAVDLTAHLGYSAQAPFSKKATGRVRPLVNLEGYGGPMLPFRDSVFVEDDNKLGSVRVTFGFEAAVGLTF